MAAPEPVQPELQASSAPAAAPDTVESAPEQAACDACGGAPCRCAVVKGMRLEARDRQNPSMVCVAHVKAVNGPMLTISFDGWPDRYTYDAPIGDPDLHYVGWCADNGRKVAAPGAMSNITWVSWEDYLQRIHCQPVPPELFGGKPADATAADDLALILAMSRSDPGPSGQARADEALSDADDEPALITVRT